MLRVCRRITTEFKRFYTHRKSNFASLLINSSFTSFSPLEYKRADTKLLDFALNPASTMDPPSSIITQVSRDQDHSQLNSYQASLPNTGSRSSVNSSDGLVAADGDEGLLNSFFCCFKKPKRSTVSAFQNEPPPSPKLPQAHNKYLLPEPRDELAEKKCVVIDLDETLVHSSFKPVSNADFIVPVEIDGIIHQVYVLKRPYVDEFLRRMGQMFECVLFTASLAKYADPVSDLLDTYGTFHARLFRESCVFHRGNYVKDLSKLGRDIRKVVIIDNSPASYIFNPDNAIPVSSWFDDPNDTELRDLIPFFEALDKVDNVLTVLGQSPLPHTSLEDDEDLT